jgi:hypothetical protein
MSRELQPANKKACYTCRQWQGNRTLMKDVGKIKVDIREEGNCSLWHKKMRGDKCCDQHDLLVF